MALFGNNKEKGAAGTANLKVDITQNGTELIVKLIGRLDTLTSPDLEDKLEEALEGVEKLVFDLEDLDYISSAGLRVLLGASQEMDEVDGGEMMIRNITQPVREVFEVTGFNTAFNIE